MKEAQNEVQEKAQANRVADSGSQDYVFVEGTKISIQPPADFIKAHTFTGFQKTESGASIMIVQFPASYAQMKTGMTPENFKTKGIEIDSTRELRMDNVDATIMFGKQYTVEYEVGKVILILGTDEEVYLFNGNYPLGFDGLKDELTTSFLSCKYNLEEEIILSGPEDYTIDIEASNLQLAKKIGVMYYYSEDGLFPTEKEHKTSLIATRSFGEVSTDDPKQYAIDRFINSPYELETVEETDSITIDGVNGYITRGTGRSKKNGTNYSIAQVILFSDDMYYIFMASVALVYEDRMAAIIETIKSFKRK
ncbi:MAG: hypothetical protein NXI10_13525 [bacterium]|nr:hypothetical protein [bacterium]